MIKKIHLLILVLLTAFFSLSGVRAQKKDNGAKIKNIVFLHGAFVDGQFW